MKKILIVAYEFPPKLGGIGRYLYNLSYGFSLKGCKITVITNIDQPVKCRNVKIIPSLGRGKFDDMISIYDEFKRGKYDYCILGHSRSFIIGSILCLTPVFNNKILIPLHGSELLKAQATSLFAFSVKLLIKKSRMLFPNSKYTSKLLDQKNFKKLRVVYPALQTKWLDVDQKVKPTSTVKTFGSISRLVSRKGHDVILQALGELKQDFKFRYLIGGIGSEEENLRQLVKTLNLENNVVFLGKVAEENLIEFYDSLDVYIMLNRIECGDVEGFGYSFAEAAARYIPSIGGANGGAVEVIPANGGFLVDTEDLDQVKDAIISYIKSDGLIQEHGINANMFCRRNFSLEKMVDGFLCEI